VVSSGCVYDGSLCSCVLFRDPIYRRGNMISSTSGLEDAPRLLGIKKSLLPGFVYLIIAGHTVHMTEARMYCPFLPLFQQILIRTTKSHIVPHRTPEVSACVLRITCTNTDLTGLNLKPYSGLVYTLAGFIPISSFNTARGNVTNRPNQRFISRFADRSTQTGFGPTSLNFLLQHVTAI
jgi:hypothetical protein